MRHFKFLLIFSVIFFYASLGCANQFPKDKINNLSQNHKINYQLPNASSWQRENQESDPAGYTEVYKTDFAGATHRVTLNYGNNIATPLLTSMQEVLKSHATTSCRIQQAKIIKQNRNSIVFTTLLDKCPNNKSLMQVYKIFNMPDGQYCIMYSTNNPQPPDPTFLKKLKNMVVSSYIV